MTAVPLSFGNLIAENYEDSFHHANPIIDELREKMVVSENTQYSAEYLEADKRSIANCLQVFFKDGTATEAVEIHYPVGHRRRREEGIPLLEKKFQANLATRFPAKRCEEIYDLCKDQARLEQTPVHEFMSMLVI
jgi:2-methylcitrate dehydratase